MIVVTRNHLWLVDSHHKGPSNVDLTSLKKNITWLQKYSWYHLSDHLYDLILDTSATANVWFIFLCFFLFFLFQLSCYFLPVSFFPPHCYFFPATFIPVTFFPGQNCYFFPVSLSPSRLLPLFLLLFFLLLFFLPKTYAFFPVTFFPVTFFSSTEWIVVAADRLAWNAAHWEAIACVLHQWVNARKT